MKFINNLLESMEEKRKREERQAAMVLGGGCLIFIVLGIVMMIISGILNAIETANVNNLFGDTYASTCQTVPAGSDSIDNLTDASPPRQALLLIANTQRRHEWHDAMPVQWRAENADEVALIGCVEEESILLETCEYQRPSARGTGTYPVRIEREQYQVTLILVNPRTARRIDSLTIDGTEPDPCPEDDGEFGSDTQYGGEVEWGEFASWIEGYVF